MLILLFTLLAQARWQAPEKCPGNVELATEMAQYKLSGASIVEKSKCVSQNKYKHIKSDSIFAGERTEEPVETVGSYTIQEIKEVETDMGKEVLVTLHLELSPGKSKRIESFSMIRLDQAPTKSDFGCAMSGSKDLEGLYILSSCK